MRAFARCAAIREPIVPAPRTATRRIGFISEEFTANGSTPPRLAGRYNPDVPMRTLFVFAAFSFALVAQDFSQIKPLPPSGIPISQQDQRILRAGLDRLGKRIEALKGNPHLPDVEV